MTDWRIEKVEKPTVWRLFHDGHQVVDPDGKPVDYESEESAQHVAANWELYRAPLWAERQAMTDAELIQKHDFLVSMKRRFGF